MLYFIFSMKFFLPCLSQKHRNTFTIAVKKTAKYFYHTCHKTPKYFFLTCQKTPKYFCHTCHKNTEIFKWFAQSKPTHTRQQQANDYYWKCWPKTQENGKAWDGIVPSARRRKMLLKYCLIFITHWSLRVPCDQAWKILI
jgi:hypothetical protein